MDLTAMTAADLDLGVLYTQAAAGVFLGLVLGSLWREYHHAFLRDWAWSAILLGVYNFLAASTHPLVIRFPDPAHPLRLGLTALSVTVGYGQLVLLATGSARLGRWTFPRVWVGLAAGAGLASVAALLILALTHASPSLRLFVREGVRSAVFAMVLLMSSIAVWRDATKRHGTGSALLAGVFLTYSVTEVLHFVATLGVFAGSPRGGFLNAISPVHLALQLTIGLGMCVWLLERERDTASSAAVSLARSQGELERTVADLRRAVDERTAAESKALHAQKLESLGVLAGGIAHDFNNLLVGILGYADLAIAELEGHPEARGHVKQLMSGAHRASELTRQLLYYAGGSPLVRRPVSLSSIAGDVARLLQVSAGRRARLVTNFDPRTPAISADPAQLQQVVINLIVNASEAIGDRDGNIVVQTEGLDLTHADLAAYTFGGERPPGRYAVLEVIDDGVGMPEDVLARIFDPFFSTKFVGRGLGLSAVQGIIRAHDGSMRVRTIPGLGTTFTIIFPAIAEVVAVDAPATVPAASWKGGGTVLVVDDEAVVRKLCLNILRQQGFEGVEAPDGETALDLIEKGTVVPDAVLLDLTMPGLGGAQTLDRLRVLRPGLPVVVFSGYGEDAITTHLAGRSGVSFLSKPFTIGQLRDSLGAAMGS